MADHRAKLISGILTIVPGTLVRFQAQVNALVNGQMFVMLKGLVTSSIFASKLLRSMNDKLVISYSNSNGSGKVAALLTTLVATEFVIVPKVTR